MNKMILTKITVILCAVTLIGCGGKSGQQNSQNESDTEEIGVEIPTVSANGTVNYLGAKGSINFDGVTYNLAWSNPPQLEGAYYIQEYMPDGQVIEQYEDIFILDLYKNENTSIETEVKEKTDWLDNRKKSDPTTVYKVTQNESANEYVVDLIVSDGDIIEWNVIRYTGYEENGKFAGVKSFTMSKRRYKGMDAFIKEMHPVKSKLVKEFNSLPFPQVKPQ